MSPRLAREHGGALLSRLQDVDRLAEQALEPYPRWRGNGTGRPSPEEEALASRIRDLRTSRSKELGLDRGVLLSNTQISEIVRVSPTTQEELRGIPGVRDWQMQILGNEVLRLVKAG
jgi:ribonuclease D